MRITKVALDIERQPWELDAITLKSSESITTHHFHEYPIDGRETIEVLIQR
jgi:hypothetical protein